MFNLREKEIHDFCENRWEYYIQRDGAYYPSKHDKVVYEDAVKEFNISIDEVDSAFQKVAKIKAEAEIKGMSKAQMKDVFKNIVEGNAETPWGQNK